MFANLAAGEKDEETYAWQRGNSARSVRGGGESRIRLSRHPFDRGQRVHRGLRRSLRRMGAQRKGRIRGCGRRVDCGCEEHGVHEACRRQCRRRPHVHRGLHRRQRRARDSRRGRPRYAQLPERAGHPLLCKERAHPHARTRGQRGGKGVHQARVRAFRELRHPRVCAHHDQARPFPELCRGGGEG